MSKKSNSNSSGLPRFEPIRRGSLYGDSGVTREAEDAIDSGFAGLAPSGEVGKPNVPGVKILSNEGNSGSGDTSKSADGSEDFPKGE